MWLYVLHLSYQLAAIGWLTTTQVAAAALFLSMANVSDMKSPHVPAANDMNTSG